MFALFRCICKNFCDQIVPKFESLQAQAHLGVAVTSPDVLLETLIAQNFLTIKDYVPHKQEGRSLCFLRAV